MQLLAAVWELDTIAVHLVTLKYDGYNLKKNINNDNQEGVEEVE